MLRMLDPPEQNAIFSNQFHSFVFNSRWESLSEPGDLCRSRAQLSLRISAAADGYVVTGHGTLAEIAAGDADDDGQPNCT